MCVKYFLQSFNYAFINSFIVVSKIDQYVIDFVKKLRDTKKISQEDIGSIIGKTSSFIGNIESPKNRAKYNLNHINKLADYFDLSPKDFLPTEPFEEE